jgi:WD40 repeat protein
MKSGQYIKTIETQIGMGAICHLVLLNDYQIAASHLNTIRIVDINTSRVVKSFKKFQSSIRSLVTLSNNLACITSDSRLHILNVQNENQSVQSFGIDNRPSCLLALPNERFVIGDERGQISVYAQTGELVQ